MCIRDRDGVLELTAMDAARRLFSNDKHCQPAFEGLVRSCVTERFSEEKDSRLVFLLFRPLFRLILIVNPRIGSLLRFPRHPRRVVYLSLIHI